MAKMVKQFALFMLFSIAIFAKANGFETKNWFTNIFKHKEKVTELQLYVQDILSGPTRSTIPVAMANSTSTSPTLFGLVAVLDDPVRTGPNPEAEIVGRAQGLFAFASLEEISIHMSFDIDHLTSDVGYSNTPPHEQAVALLGES
ncbi:hypothetical protein CASFOL_036272 [Castilleja foliolosa]|uniref:Dirigent protein n=1 Tax=Castilleja foliolosa TaxID=1961234 RepID=A0ABD3BV36_9LAMI